jgi:hypothetical protein
MTNVITKRIYQPAEKLDGFRVLVDPFHISWTRNSFCFQRLMMKKLRKQLSSIGK